MSVTDQAILVSYSLFFIVTFVLSVLINGLFLKFAQTLGIRNRDFAMIRWSADSKPSFGGISFFIIFLFSLSVYSIVFEQSTSFRNLQFIGFLMATTIGFLIGLYDDAYNTKVWLKLVSQIICAIILIATGTYINLFDNLWLNYAITLVWVIGIMNSINMLDNMDGITTLVSIFIITTTLVTILIKGDYANPYFLVMTGILASLGGFLLFNWYPSQMFMGDTGSQFLGVILATIGIIYYWNPYVNETNLYLSRHVILIMVVFSLPLIDTTTVFIKRLRKGRSPFVGGKDHTTHHLSYLGLSDRQVAWIIIAISLVNAIISLIIVFLFPEWKLPPAIFCLIYFLILFSGLFYIANLNQHK